MWLHQCELGRCGGAGAEGVCGERCAHRWRPPRAKAEVEAVRGVSVAEERLLMRQMQLLRW